MGVSESLIRSLDDSNISKATDIQVKTIPLFLEAKKDLVVVAKTGTGKTAAFGLPLLQLIDSKKPEVQAIILAPTRELGQQIHKNLSDFAAYLPEISIASVCGGIPIKPQIERLKLDTHIVVATPGRFIDLIKRKSLHVNQTQYLVLDEADEMLGDLKTGLDTIVSHLPKNKRTFLFTATMPGTIKQLVQNYLSKHVLQIEADMQTKGHQGIDHQYVVVEPIEKLQVLMHFLNSRLGERGIIFCKTKAAVNKLSKNLAIHKFSSGALHGSLSQGIRDRIMGQFREGHIDILVATDLAARGIDVKEISYVVNYHLPDAYETYVHRSGRTARAGAEGLSLTIIQPEEQFEIADFEKELSISFKRMPKADEKSILENKVLLWAKQIFKTKPNHKFSEHTKDQVHTIFHHLTKQELIEKAMAHYLTQNNPTPDSKKKSKKKNTR